MMASKSFVFKFSEFEVRERELRLTRAGDPLPVEPKAFRVLLCLLRTPGQVVPKDELLHAVWGETAVTDNSLTRAVALLRKVLDDDPRSPRYIETVSTVGYRFLGSVTVADDLPRASDGTGHPHSTAHTDPHLRSIAVLPFTNGAGNQDTDYLSDGISESIINLLSRLRNLRVIPRTSTFRYRGETDLKAVGKDLNVSVVLTGIVNHRGDGLIVQTELVDVVNDAQLWGGQYKGNLEDIFQVQQDLARQISGHLQLRLTQDEEMMLNERPTENREAYLLYLKGNYYANKWTPDGIRKGIECARQAIEVDPLFAGAYTGLAYLYIQVGAFRGLPPSQAFPRAKAAAMKALEIDEKQAGAHASLAAVYLLYDWDWKSAEAESRRALELGPHLAEVHFVRSHWCVTTGLSDEAIAEAGKAHALDPLCLPFSSNLAQIYYLVHNYEATIQQAQRTLELDPSFAPARYLLALAYVRAGKVQEALAEAGDRSVLSAADSRPKSIFGLVNALAGKQDEARMALEELEKDSVPPNFSWALHCAAILANLGELDLAFEWLDKACQGRSTLLPYLKLMPHFAVLQTDPRFENLLRRIGIPD